MAKWERASDIGKRLRALRLALGLRQVDMAEVVGVTSQTISDWEGGRGAGGPPSSTLHALAKRTGIPVAAFGEGGPAPATFVRPPYTGGTPDTPTPVRGLVAEPLSAPEAAAAGRHVVLRAVARVTQAMEAGEDIPVSEFAFMLEEAYRAGEAAGRALPRPADV